jgi:hypothetical protein
MDKYNIIKFIERKQTRPFLEFREEFRREHKYIESFYSRTKFKNKDEEFEVKSYYKILGDLRFFLDTGMDTIPFGSEISTIEILRPAIENYVQQGQLDKRVLVFFIKNN